MRDLGYAKQWPERVQPGLLILLGSSRGDGDTAVAVQALRRELCRPSEVVDLSTLSLRPFDYSAPRQADDFDAVVERMLSSPAVLFATPVYWYAMSGLMKTLFDRFSDLLSDRDPARRGRGLAGRSAFYLAVGADARLPGGFETPFRRTARYLGMVWGGGAYVCTAQPAAGAEQLRVLAKRIASPAA